MKTIEDNEYDKFDENSSVKVANKTFSLEYNSRTFNATAASVTLTNTSKLLRLIADQDCYVRFDSTSPTGLTNAILLKANVAEYVPIVTNTIKVLRMAADGTLNILVMY